MKRGHGLAVAAVLVAAALAGGVAYATIPGPRLGNVRTEGAQGAGRRWTGSAPAEMSGMRVSIGVVEGLEAP
jgi:hypothetical protein